MIYFDSFGVEYIPKEIKTSIFRIQDNNSIMRGYFCILFIEYMLNNKTLTEEIQYQQFLANKLSKYLTVFDYSNKILTVFLTVFSGTNIISNVKNKQLLGLITSVFSLLFSLFFGIIIKLQQETKLRKKKHNKLLYLAKNK